SSRHSTWRRCCYCSWPMNRPEAVKGVQWEGGSMDRHSGTNGLIAVVLIVLAIGVLAEVVAGRSVTTTSDLLRTTSWQALLDTGHRARARGDAPAAPRAYLHTLLRARCECSVLG